MYPAATAEELGRIGGLVEAYCASPLAARLAALEGVAVERPFAFEHDGVLFHGFLDVLHRDGGRALVADYKSNAIGDHSPAEIVEAEYRLQRLVYAIACFRAGAEEVEVVYQFLERPDAARRGRLPARAAARARGRALGGDRPDPGGPVPAAAERVGVRRVPGARRGLRRARAVR